MRWRGGNTGGTESKAVLTVLNVKNGKSESPLSIAPMNSRAEIIRHLPAGGMP